MKILRLLPLLLGLAAMQAAPTQPAANLFKTLLGKSEAQLDAKLDAAWQSLFNGNDDSARVYYPVGSDLAYIADVGSADVRSEGMSYGLMIAVQRGKQAEFNRLWKWCKTYMYHATGPRRGYFAWQCKFDGTQIDPGSASDGEEWFAMALLFASHRWGDGAGIFNYGEEAQRLLREMIHKRTTGTATAIFDRKEHQVVFAPTTVGSQLTDPSYHLPAFYELWSQWAAEPDDRVFWQQATTASRAFLRRAANPQTGLMPEYANFDGSPYGGLGEGKQDFRFDAWRTLANVGLDHAWFPTDGWATEQSNRVLRFLASHGPERPNQFTLAGKPLSKDSSVGLTAMAAVAGLAADPAVARPFVQQLWDAPIPTGHWRYYDGLLYFLGLMETGGRFKIYSPPIP
ncbi:MAG: glycosyl hydrolase family 8 [Lacunisphaera sp.]